MPEIHNTNASPATPAPENWFVEWLKKQALGVAIGVALLFYNFIWQSHDSGRDLAYRVDTNSKAIEKLQQADKEQSETQNQIIIGITKLSEAQTRLAQDVKAIQDQQQRNTEMLFNRR